GACQFGKANLLPEKENTHRPFTSVDGSTRTAPTHGSVVQTGNKKFRAYDLSGKLISVAASQGAADAMLLRGKTSEREKRKTTVRHSFLY
ncbi:hypothetical protein OAH51_01595, partial [Verrucomicrobia bacterium]|nr:hypothetical protein [Verrucomicrobiota bacterium]